MNFSFFRYLRTNSLPLVGFLAVFISISNVQANMVPFQFEGELTEVDKPLLGTFSTGDKFTGSYTFDSTIVGTLEGNTVVHENAISAMSFTTGTYTASATNGFIEYFDALGNEGLDIGNGIFVSSSPSLILGDPVEGNEPTGIIFVWLLSDSAAPLFQGDTPLVKPHFDPGQQGSFILFFDFSDTDGSNGRIIGDLTSVTVVPIPPTIWLFSTSLLGLIGFTKRKRVA